MQTDIEQLWGEIQDIGQDADNVPQIPSEVVAKLVRLKLVVVIEGRPSLTTLGEKGYRAMEGGLDFPLLDGSE